MPFDSSGVASVAGQRPVNGQDTDAAQINVPLDDIQSMLSQTLLKSGVAPMVGPLNMNGFRATNLAEATNDDDAITKAQFETQLDEELTPIRRDVNPSFSSVSLGFTASDTDYGKTFRTTAPITIAFSATSGLRENWKIYVWAEANTVIDPDSTNTINGASTLLVLAGQSAEIFRSSATEFRAVVSGNTLSGPQLQDFRAGLSVINAPADLVNDITVSQGSASQDAAPYSLMQLSSAITKRIDALWTAGTGNGGLDTGAAANSTYYIWLIQRPDTNASDVLFSLSATSPTLPANYTYKRLIGSFVRASGSNRVPVVISDVTAAQLGALTATLTPGSLGSYAFMSGSTAATASGSVLFYADSNLSTGGQPPADSIWQRMGYAQFSDRSTLWLRIQ